MTFDTLQLAIDSGVATVTINRPDKLNALNAVCKSELRSLLGSLRSDASVGAVIVTGSGRKAFMAGTDIGELAGLDAEGGRAFAAGGQALFDEVEGLGKPVIAAVNGFALGGGCELAIACHLRIASEGAKFGQPEVNLGIIPGYGGTQRLARLIGPARATELILTGRQVDAQEALRIGLVNDVVPDDDLLPRAAALAGVILTKGPAAVRAALEALHAVHELPLREGLAIEARLFGGLCASEDFREGTSAFLEKRQARFTGR